jgi:uncharacterized protein involved in exopolysaccharide biosynthesis
MELEQNSNISNSNIGNPRFNASVINMIKDLLKIWWLFLIVAVVAGIVGILYASKQEIKYKSRLTFALDDGDQNGIGSFLSFASQLGINMGSGKDIFAGDNIIDIMKSRRMIERVLLSVDTFNNKPYTLIEYFLDRIGKRKSNSNLEKIHFPPGQDKATFSYQQDSLLYTTYLDFANNFLQADRPDRKLSIYEVNVTSPDEKFTKDFTDRIVNETNNFYVEIRTKKAKETLNILEDRVATMKGNLNSSISNKAAVQDVNVNPAFSAAQVPVLKQQTNIQVYSAAYGEMFKNLELARFQYLNEIPLMQIIDPADYPMQKIKVSKLKAGLIFSLIACLLLFIIFWFRRIMKLSSVKNF